MKLPSLKRLTVSDFDKDDQSLVDQLSFPINGALESLFDLTLNQVSLRDNVACTVTSLTVTVDASGTPKKVTSFPLKLPTAVDGCLIIRAVSATNSPIYPTATPFITGAKNQNSFYINNISGLPENVPFNLTIITFQN